MRLAGLVEAAMPRAKGMQTNPGRFSSGGSMLRRKRCRTAPRRPGSCRGGCAEHAAEPLSHRSGFAARRSDVPCRAAGRPGTEELESRLVPPAFCGSPAAFSRSLFSSMGAWRALVLGFPSAAGGCAEPQPPCSRWAACGWSRERLGSCGDSELFILLR